MSTEVWDGKPRRKGDVYLETIENKVDRVFAFMKGEFGDEGIDGKPIEGRTKKALREIKEQVDKTNGRVTNLEKWQTELETKEQDEKDVKDNRISFINVCAAAVMAVAAIVVLFKH